MTDGRIRGPGSEALTVEAAHDAGPTRQHWVVGAREPVALGPSLSCDPRPPHRQGTQARAGWCE